MLATKVLHAHARFVTSPEIGSLTSGTNLEQAKLNPYEAAVQRGRNERLGRNPRRCP